MAITIDGNTGVSKVQDGVIVQADLASGVAGTGPAFSAFQSTATSVSTNTSTKIKFNSVNFDTNSDYDTSLFRFTPTVAGYYEVILIARDGTGLVTGFVSTIIQKNGTAIAQSYAAAGGFGPAPLSSSIVFMNGLTDFLEGFYFQSSGSTVSLNVGSSQTYFQAVMVRGA